MNRITRLMKYLWPHSRPCLRRSAGGGRPLGHRLRMGAAGKSALAFVLVALLLLWGCFDAVDSPEGDAVASGIENAPLIVKRAKALVEGAPAFSLLDMHRAEGDTLPSARKRTAGGFEVDWEDFRLVVDRDCQMAVFPIRGTSHRTAFTALTMGGCTHKRMNHVTSKLLVRQNGDGTLTGVVLTYIYDEDYNRKHGGELSSLCYSFKDTHFTGYFITSRLDGTMLLGRRIEGGKEVFSFRRRPAYAPKAAAASGADVHLFLHLDVEVAVKRTSVLDFEYDPSMKCSFCGKGMEECTCLEIVVCQKCKQRVVDGKCGCPKEEEDKDQDKIICPICNGVINDLGQCRCCPLCRMLPCRCGSFTGGTSPGGGNSGGNNSGGNNSGGGGGVRPPGGGGNNSGGNNSGGTQAAVPGTTAVRSAAEDAVAAMTRKYGTTAACNYGVQAAFKAIFGSSNLPPGMKGDANEMTRAWKGNPQYWEEIELSETIDYANKGYFVVAGYIDPAGGSGHVVVILSGKGTYSKKWGCQVPNTMDTGSGKRWTNQFLSNSYGPEKKRRVTYYYYKH